MTLIKKNPTTTKSWAALKIEIEKLKRANLKDLFNQDKDRFKNNSIIHNEIIFDYSKNYINQTIKNLLIDLANELNLKDAIDLQFSGSKINETENRAVLHTALRDKNETPIIVDGINIANQINISLNKMKQFCHEIHNGLRLGCSNKKIKYIVNIGIGGSDLGPVMVTEALKPFWIEGIETYFVSNIDFTHLQEVLKKVKADETLFLIASKTFTTQETMTNAFSARDWFLTKMKDEKHIAKHFVALSTNKQAVEQFGIDLENMFEFWDWVGGRYSLWSAIGLSIALTVGFDNFNLLLDGAFEADQHFKNQSLENNIPVLMALIGIININFLDCTSQAILPYSQYLHRFPAYLQQAEMESNGKQIDRNGNLVHYNTGAIIFGEAGTNGQHAFYQLIHQGTTIIPCDFIGVVNSLQKLPPQLRDHQNKLMANCFAQTEALMNGKTLAEVQLESKNPEIDAFKVFYGNRPTNTFLLKSLSPKNLGALIAYYEHKIFVQGYIWNIYSYDQYGVQLGKQLADKVLPNLQSNQPNIDQYNSSTNGLINYYNQWKN